MYRFMDETNTEIRILHIYLDERDLRDEVWHNLRPNGFTESRVFNDFPQHEYKVALHVRRRRWLPPEGKSHIFESLPLVADGTSYSVEFATKNHKHIIMTIFYIFHSFFTKK